MEGNKKWAKTFSSMQKASCLKQNQKWEQMESVVLKKWIEILS